MLYAFLKIYARLVIKIYCREILINRQDILNSEGPILLAVNHPNSFLDAIILDTLFDQPVYSLARGDTFKKKSAARLLRALNILPVFRESEGKEHLHRNYHTFDECLSIFRKKGIVLIFSEALCENEWHLRPLKKGTSRLATAAWEQGIPLKILPIGLNYSSYHLFGKNVHINFGDFIEHGQIKNTIEDNGKQLIELNEQLEVQLKKLVYEIDITDKKKQAEVFTIPVSSVKRTLLILPAFAGIISHVLLYLPVKKFTWKMARHSGHYDSIMTGLLLLVYPLYLSLCAIGLIIISGNWYGLLVFLVFPFFAWSYVQLKQQTDS